MGAWGHKLYENDVACDLREEFKDLKRLPMDGDGLLEVIGNTVGIPGDEDEDGTSFWLALADQYWKHGIDSPAVLARARDIIESGADDRLMADLDMSEKDREKRRKHLADIGARWAAPNSRPTKRNVFKKPELHAVAPGEIYAIPTEGGNAPNTYFPAAYIDEHFAPDGWAAFAVTNVAHLLGYYSAAHFIRIHVDGPDKPGLEQCRKAPVSGVHYFMMERDAPLAHAAGVAEITKTVLKKMRAENLGSVEFSWAKVCDRINGAAEFETTRRRGSLCGLLQVYQPMLGEDGFMDYAAPLDITVADLLA
jgi:hypothetical protein